MTNFVLLKRVLTILNKGCFNNIKPISTILYEVWEKTLSPYNIYIKIARYKQNSIYRNKKRFLNIIQYNRKLFFNWRFNFGTS